MMRCWRAAVGTSGKTVNGGFTPVWVSDLGDGSYYVGIFNLNAFATRVQVDWKDLGFAGASQIRDLWNHVRLGASFGAFSDVLPGMELGCCGSGHLEKSPRRLRRFMVPRRRLYMETRNFQNLGLRERQQAHLSSIGAANYAV